jgi:hypothetical protein
MIILNEVRNKDTNKKHVMYKNEIKKKKLADRREKEMGKECRYKNLR